ncbi:hypothetical protein FS749_015671 [Ceratobasidium sp. UAMH 11750]|nr:hypothetical protein FS749_015671 [Ceratobasidium sp. UAMH 11750]
MPIEDLRLLVDPETPSAQRDKAKYSSKSFLYAQCRMFLEPSQMPSEKAKVSTLQSALWGAIQAGQTTPPALLALEQLANQQFNDMLERLRGIMSSTRYIPPTSASHDVGPPAKRAKRKQPSKGLQDFSFSSGMVAMPPTLPEPENHTVPAAEVAIENSRMSLDLDTASPPPITTPAVASTPSQVPSADPAPYKRGDRSAILDTEKYRARNPKSLAESFLLQLLVDPSRISRAMQIVQSVPDPSSKQNLGTKASLSTELADRVRACVASGHAADVASYQTMLAHTELAVWFLK